MNSPDSTPTGYDPATAYHEAGHAVVALALGRVVHRVSVLPNQEILGKCEFRKGRSKPSHDWVEEEILIALAGMVAEARWSGNMDRAAAGKDLRYARKLALQRASEKSLERFERRMLGKVESLLDQESNWRAVELIAGELTRLGMISGRAALHFFELSRSFERS